MLCMRLVNGEHKIFLIDFIDTYPQSEQNEESELVIRFNWTRAKRFVFKYFRFLCHTNIQKEMELFGQFNLKILPDFLLNNAADMSIVVLGIVLDWKE